MRVLLRKGKILIGLTRVLKKLKLQLLSLKKQESLALQYPRQRRLQQRGVDARHKKGGRKKKSRVLLLRFQRLIRRLKRQGLR